MAVVPNYRVVVAALNGAEQDEIQVSNLTFGFALNDPGGLDFTMHYRDPKCTPTLMAPGKKELHVYRGTTLVWGGYLWTATPSYDDGSVRFGGEGYLSRLKYRSIDTSLSYSAVDQFQIGWNLIAFTQAKTDGNLGFTRFSAAASGVTRNRNYVPWERMLISDALEEFANLSGGFDYEITANKEYKNYYPSKGSTLGLQYELGKNIDGLSYDIDASSMATEVTALGAGDGSDTCIAVSVDATARGSFGLLQETISVSEIQTFSYLQEAADEELRIKKGARWQPQINVSNSDPPFTSISTGDIVTLKANEGYIQMNNAFRVTNVQVQVDTDGQETYQVMFDGVTT